MEIRVTERFDVWLKSMRDKEGKARIYARIVQCKLAGRPVGDIRPLGEGVSELRIHSGPGYRVYFAQKGDIVMMLLAGGDKRRQSKDIATAKKLLQELVKEKQW